MSACELCWDDAFKESRITGESQAEAYRRLLSERNQDDRHLRDCVRYRDDRNASAWNIITLGDGSRARLAPVGSMNRLLHPDGSERCWHNDSVPCDLEGHETVLTYQVEPLPVPAHELVVTFDGDAEYVSLVCNQEGADRPCAVIDCPVDHEDVNRACINEHGAIALDECWAVSWMDNGGRETLDADALGPVRIPVIVEWDEGVVVRPA